MSRSPVTIRVVAYLVHLSSLAGPFGAPSQHRCSLKWGQIPTKHKSISLTCKAKKEQSTHILRLVRFSFHESLSFITLSFHFCCPLITVWMRGNGRWRTTAAYILLLSILGFLTIFLLLSSQRSQVVSTHRRMLPRSITPKRSSHIQAPDCQIYFPT